MRICYIGDAKSTHVQKWLEYYSGQGHEVCLISTRSPDNNGITGVRYYQVSNIKLRIKTLGYLVRLVSNYFYIKRILKEFKPNILHVHFITELGFIAALINYHPLILNAWGSDILLFPEKRKITKNILKYTLSSSDVILTINNFIRNFIIEQYNIPKEKTLTLKWGVDRSIFKSDYLTEILAMKKELAIKYNSFILLSPRHLASHYRIENIIKSTNLLSEKGLNITLILLKGLSEDEMFINKINNLIEQLEISQNVRLIKRHLSPREMAILYNLSNAFISIPRSDGFASTIMEGMACGSVPIVSNLEVYKQYLEHDTNSLFVNPDDLEDIAEKIIYCINHPEIKEKFFRINDSIIEKFEDWDQNALKMTDIYNNLINNKQI